VEAEQVQARTRHQRGQVSGGAPGT
jgi:hypothetical protein